MSNSRLPQASAFLLALVATLATLGGIDTLAATQGEASRTAPVVARAAPIPTQRIVVVAPNYQRVVVVAPRHRA